MLYKKIETFSVDVIKTFESHTSYAVSAFEFLIFFDALSCSVSGGQRVLKSSKVESCFHFTRKDEYLCKYFSSCKFLWMSLFQFLKLYPLSHMFICSGALVELLFLGKSSFGPIWLRNSPKILSFFTCIHLMVASNQPTSLMNDL